MSDPSLLQELSRFRDATGVPAVLGGVMEANGAVALDVVGVRRRDHAEWATVEDAVHIGSCCKMLTASLFGTFVTEQRADWNMAIPELFPDLSQSMAEGWQDRTVAELLYCLSGMAANPSRRFLKSGYADTRSLVEQRTELTQLALSKPPKRPGRFVYSNLGYMVVGAAIDRLSGTSFEQSLASRILEPLGVTSAGYGPPPQLWGHGPKLFIGGLALFKGRAAAPTNPRSDNPPAMSAAGTLHMTCRDWARVLRLFQSGGHQSVLDEAVILRTLTMPEVKGAPMAMGWGRVELPGVRYGAQGSNVRWSATVLMDEARQRIALVACNDGRSSVLRHSVMLAHQLLGRASGERP